MKSDGPAEQSHGGANAGPFTASFSADVFSLDTIKKAAYQFSDRASFDFQVSASEILVRLHVAPTNDQQDAAALVADFRNEVLDQDLRRTIAEETAPIRNAILGYAFSRTGLQSK